MTWWGRLWRGKKMDEQLDKELRFHLEQHAADLMRQGYRADEARRIASLEFGGPEQVKEECRDVRGTRWLDDLGQDCRYVFRTMRQKPGFAVVALLTLALGIGATTVMFSVVDGVLLKQLPYHDPSRLVAVHGESSDWNATLRSLYGAQNIAYYDFLDCQRLSRTLELTGWTIDRGTLSAPGEPEYVAYFEVASNIFSILGVPVAQGRAFLPEEDRAGGAPVAILGYSFWRRRFGGTPAMGTAIVLDGKTYTVVGVANPRFRLDSEEPDLLIPIGQNTMPFMRNRRAHPVGVMGRLRPGATLAQARAELAGIARGLQAKYPDTNKDRTYSVETLRPPVEDVQTTLWLLLGAVTIVLLIACANIASLLLARAVSRERELAMRIALGAGRFRLVRQCLTESAVLGLGGGAVGIAVAAIGLRPFLVYWPGTLPRADEVHLDWRVLSFALIVSLVSGLLFGLAPALRAPVRDLEHALRAGARTVAGGSRRLHAAFVISEVALALVLLVCAGMLGRTLLRLSSLDPGVNIHNVLTARAALSPSTLASPAQVRAAWRDILDRGRAVPGVQAIAIVDTVPLRSGSNAIPYATSAAGLSDKAAPLALATSVTPDYLKVMKIQLREGRFIQERDRLDSQTVVVIDDVMARQAFPGQEPLGRRLWIDLGGDPVTVVGVVGHVRYWGLAADDAAKIRAQVYYPFAQVPDRLVRRWSELMSIVVRTNVDPLSVLGPLRRVVRASASDQVLYQVRTMEQLATESVARQRFLVLLFGIFGGLALLLACIGVYGVLSYLTSRRVPEIGVRMALGARAYDVIWLVLSESLGMIVRGAVIGIIGAWAAARLLERSVEGMRSMEPFAWLAMIAVLVVAALVASLAPAVRASRVDPARTLRGD